MQRHEQALFSDAHVVRTLTETLSKKRLREEETVAARFFTAKELTDCVYELTRYAVAARPDSSSTNKSPARMRRELDLHNAMVWIYVDPLLTDLVFSIGGRFAPPHKYRRVAVHADFVQRTAGVVADGLPLDFADLSDRTTALVDLDERYPHLKAKAVFLSELNAAPVSRRSVLRALTYGGRGRPVLERAAMTLAKVAHGLRRAALALAQNDLDTDAILDADARAIAALQPAPPLSADHALTWCIVAANEADVFYNTTGRFLNWRDLLTDEDRAACGVVRSSEMIAALHEGRTDAAVLQALAAARAVDHMVRALWHTHAQ